MRVTAVGVRTRLAGLADLTRSCDSPHQPACTGDAEGRPDHCDDRGLDRSGLPHRRTGARNTDLQNAVTFVIGVTESALVPEALLPMVRHFPWRSGLSGSRSVMRLFATLSPSKPWALSPTSAPTRPAPSHETRCRSSTCGRQRAPCRSTESLATHRSRQSLARTRPVKELNDSSGSTRLLQRKCRRGERLVGRAR